MKTRKNCALLFLVLLSLSLSGCHIGGSMMKENDGFGKSGFNQNNKVIHQNTTLAMN
jgi:hypothetical protein